MWKTIINQKNATVITDTGMCFQKSNLTERDIEKILNANHLDDVLEIMIDDYRKKVRLNKVKQSKILTFKDNSIYWNEVSKLSLPEDFAVKVLEAEGDENNLLIETYRNFWTLMSLNPNEECRKNLFWFLTKYGLQLSKHGFFVAYRNVDFTNEEGVYTDRYSHTFRIKIGEIVTLDINKCDSNSNVECSRGLHVAGRTWLERNYFGDMGVVCLVNPADVVAVPKVSDYGKLRTCAYLPIDKIEYGEDGHPVKFPKEDGFDCSYVSKVIYEGLFHEEQDPYKISLDTIKSENEKKKIKDSLLVIAKQAIIDRTMN